MQVEIFALCDAATDQQGKLNILGTFDTLAAQQAPVAHPQCAVALRIRFNRIESGAHRIQIGIVNADGQPVVPTVETAANVQMNPPADSSSINAIINLQRIQFPAFGRYSIDLAIDGRQEGSLPLFVRQVPQAA